MKTDDQGRQPLRMQEVHEGTPDNEGRQEPGTSHVLRKHDERDKSKILKITHVILAHPVTFSVFLFIDELPNSVNARGHDGDGRRWRRARARSF